MLILVKTKRYVSLGFLVLFICLKGCKASQTDILGAESELASNAKEFYAKILPLTSPSLKNFRDFMLGKSLRLSNCPVGFSELVLMVMPHHDLEGNTQIGQLIVHRDVASEVESIFGRLYKQGFQIEKMRIVSVYDADDDKSMEANNTSAFNCRKKTGGTSFSVHSFGKAIDINPLYNPYIKGNKILPPQGKEYVDRTQLNGKQFILKGSQIVSLFTQQGWEWGGNYNSLKDFHHFEKKE